MRKCPLARHSDLVIQAAGDETLVYDLETNKAYSLNETSASIWGLCDGRRSVAEMSIELGKRLNAQINEDLIWIALDQLTRENLLLNGTDLRFPFDDLPRRDLIKKVGIGSAVSLPFVASILAPTSINAQSCTALFAPCAAPADCCSSNCPTLPNDPDICCVTGATFNNLAGDPRIGCSSVGDQVDCDGRAATACCSGAGVLAGVGTCAPFPGTVECVCL